MDVERRNRVRSMLADFNKGKLWSSIFKKPSKEQAEAVLAQMDKDRKGQFNHENTDFIDYLGRMFPELRK
jgi:hypothetical protein